MLISGSELYWLWDCMTYFSLAVEGLAIFVVVFLVVGTQLVNYPDRLIWLGMEGPSSESGRLSS